MSEFPVAVGGIGGSGTRVVARILQRLGYYIGSCLSHAQDNLWYALLFGRRDVFLDSRKDFSELFGLFLRQMSEPRILSLVEIDRVITLSRQVRCQHGPDDLRSWAESFISEGESGKCHDRWGWKVPYTHVLADRLLLERRDLKYVHLTRHALDMAFSPNQNQLRTWGPIYLNREIEIGPRDALSFWCCVHRRTASAIDEYPGRILEIDFIRLVDKPEAELARLMSFVEVDLSQDRLRELCGEIRRPKSIGRHLHHDLSGLAGEDLEYLGSIGYQIHI